MTTFTKTNHKTIAAYGPLACLRALTLNEVDGEGPTMVGGNDFRIGDNLINAGRAIAQCIDSERTAVAQVITAKDVVYVIQALQADLQKVRGEPADAALAAADRLQQERLRVLVGGLQSGKITISTRA